MGGRGGGWALGHLRPTQSQGTDLGPNIPCRKMGSSGWKFLLLLGWTTAKNRNPVTGTQREMGQIWAGDRHKHVCGGKGDRERVRFRIQRQKQPRRRWNHSDRTEIQSEPHNPGPDRAPGTEVPGERHRRLRRRGGGAGCLGDQGPGTGKGLGPLGCCRLLGHPGFTQRAGARSPTMAGRAAQLRAPGAPWPRTARPGCGRAAPSHPAAPRGQARRPPRSRES